MGFNNILLRCCAVIAFLPIVAGTTLVYGQEDAPEMEEIVVSIQRSLETALSEKRNKANLTEVINAEDVGKLPDENIAEVLENIPGVQITRDGGIGEAVSIRGSDQNRIEINGRGTTSDGEGRGGARLSDLPAALVKSLNVVKVPTADMVEGSIGGTINIKTYRGLRLKKPLKVIRFAEEYAENSDAYNENFSTTWGDKFNTEFGDIGAIATFSHIDKAVRTDSLQVRAANRPGAAGNNPSLFVDVNGNQLTFPYFYPGFSDTSYDGEERENTAFSGSLEWQVNPGLKLFMEGTYTDIERLEHRQSAIGGFGSGNQMLTPAVNGSDRELDGIRGATFDRITVGGITIPIMTSGVIGGGIRNGLTIDGLNPIAQPDDGLQLRMNSSTANRDTNSYVAAFGGEWESDDWLVEFEVSAAESDTTADTFITVFQFNDPNTAVNNPDSVNVFHTAEARLRVPFFYDRRDGNLAYGPVPGARGIGNLLDPNFYSLFVARDTKTRFDNETFSQKIDASWTLDHSFWSSLKLGIRTSQRSNERDRESVSTGLFPFGIEDPTNVGQPLYPEVSLARFLTSTPGDIFDFNSSGIYLDNFLSSDSSQVNALRQVLRDSAGLNNTGLVVPPQGFKVEEDTFAVYLRSDFDAELWGMSLSGNLGLRIIQTNQLAEGSQLLEDGFTFEPVSVRQEYANALPSASLVFSPVEKLQVRLGYAEILRRPGFAQLSPTFDFPLNSNVSVVTGDPNLEPTTATQYDLALEYYFRKGSVLSVGYFLKELDDVIGRNPDVPLICNPIGIGDGGLDCLNGAPGVRVDQITFENQPGGKIQGIEIALQHNFNWLPRPYNGLGIIANYAYQDGERDDTFNLPNFLQDGSAAEPPEFPLNFVRLSEDSYNITLYFEKPRYRWSGRIRYTYRDGFLITESSDLSNFRPLYSDDRSQLNASMSYRLTDIFTLTFSGVNLTKEQSRQRAFFIDGPVILQSDVDRRFSLGVRARF